MGDLVMHPTAERKVVLHVEAEDQVLVWLDKEHSDARTLSLERLLAHEEGLSGIGLEADAVLLSIRNYVRDKGDQHFLKNPDEERILCELTERIRAVNQMVTAALQKSGDY